MEAKPRSWSGHGSLNGTVFLSTCRKPPELRMLETGKILLDSCDDVCFFLMYTIYLLGLVQLYHLPIKAIDNGGGHPSFQRTFMTKEAWFKEWSYPPKYLKHHQRGFYLSYTWDQSIVWKHCICYFPQNPRGSCAFVFKFGNVAVSAKKQVNEPTEMWIPLARQWIRTTKFDSKVISRYI